ncbi:TP53 regulating kinase-like protein [Methanohalophilus levihalophilus]|uniref:Kae1-associated kinase Bud32 n=1 Tax=Methanohalophilus levihalophilus TaxID=1431282 RepID=UPI001FD947DE|nr:Kae1-associated kinase Bud32 [Methanohalophilus levihalophilus]MBP2030459.1 TP53 regulating kinase-like protein [Methanohalophilus levihalophilus]
MSESILLPKGAEAVVRIQDGRVIKQRIPKRYRVEMLDEKIRKERTRAEARLISEARRSGVPTPILYDVYGFTIEMEYIEGQPIKEVMSPEMCEKIGEVIGLLHGGNIIHGDLTTSNMIWNGERIYLIDFGLSFVSSNIEDKGVDVHVLFQTLESSHKDHEVLIEAFRKGYRKQLESADEILTRVTEIEKRGRYA